MKFFDGGAVSGIDLDAVHLHRTGCRNEVKEPTGLAVLGKALAPIQCCAEHPRFRADRQGVIIGQTRSQA